MSLIMLALAACFSTHPSWAADVDISTDTANYGNSGSIDHLTNSASISGNSALYNSGSISTLTNSGTITGGFFAIRNDSSGSIGTLENTGSPSVTGTLSGNTGIMNNGHIGTLINSGSIINSGQNIYNTGSIDLLLNTGSISASRTMVNIGTMGSFDNRGVIQAGGTGIYTQTLSTLGALINSGTLSAATAMANHGTIGTIANSGTILATSYVINQDTLGSIGSIINSGTLAGNILNQSASKLLFAGGSGTVFGTLAGYDGTALTIGTIDSAGSVIFTGGNQLLNDDITVGAGSGTVTNTGNSVLQVNQHITITGSFQQDASATLAFGIGADGSGLLTDTGSGRLIVAGNVNLASGSGILLSAVNGYALTAGQRYVLIQAASSSTYNAASLAYSVSGLGSTSVQASGTQQDDGSYSYLVASIADASTGSTAIARYATTRNAVNTLDGLFNYSGTDQSLLNVFNPAVALDSSSAANRAGAQLSPTATRSAAINVANLAFAAVQDTTRNRLDSLRGLQAGSGVASGESSWAPAVWGRLFGGQANQAQRDGISGYHASYGGFMLGSDVQVHPDWRVGGLFSLSKTNVGNEGDNSGSSAGINTYGLSAYAGYDAHPWYLNLTAGVARQNYSTTRAISYTGFAGTAAGSFKGLLLTTTAQAGYPLQLGKLTLTPLAGLSYSALRQDGYTESGGNGAALAINSSAYTSLKSHVGAKLERNFMTSLGELRPFVQLGWHHEFHGSALTTSGVFAADSTGSSAFATQGASPLRDTAQLSLGATLLRTGNLTLAARYTLEGASGHTAQTGDVSLRWQY